MKQYVTIPDNQLEKLEQFIRGSLLGDGSIPKIEPKRINYRFCLCHGHKQYDYLFWKNQFLSDYELSGKIVKHVAISKRYKEGHCTSFNVKSKTHPIFTKFRNLYYNSDGKKILNKEDFVKLDEFSLAIWYMDDGSVWNNKGKSSKLQLHTNSFSKEENLFMMNFLYEKWGIKTSYYNYKNSIIISCKSTPEFIKLVKPYIVDCLVYKTVHVKSCELLESPEEGNQQPSFSEMS